jgi:hypothetical protein
MLAVRVMVVACAMAPSLACSEGSLPPTAMTQTREISATGGASSACSGGVFKDTTRRGEVDHSGTIGLIRLRTVEVDLDAVRRSAETRSPLTLNIFPDACLVAQVSGVEHDAQGNLVWTGDVADASDGVAVTLVTGDDFVIGSAVSSRALYRIRYAGNGVHVVMQLNPAAFPPD